MSDQTIRSLRVFLCHASGDKTKVRKLHQRLISDGIDAWLDKENLVAGQNWQFEIPKAVRNSDVVVVCLSVQSINKEGFVQKEIRIALDVADEKPEGTIFVIPARLEQCDVPQRLSHLHWVDLFEKDGYEHLYKALQLRAHGLGIPIIHKADALPVPSTGSGNEITFPKYSSFQTDLEELIREATSDFINVRGAKSRTQVSDGYLSYESKFTFEYSSHNAIWNTEGRWYFTCTFCERVSLQQAEKVFAERVQDIKSTLADRWKFEERDKPNSLYRKEFEAIKKYNSLRIRMAIAAYNQGTSSQVDFTLEQLIP